MTPHALATYPVFRLKTLVFWTASCEEKNASLVKK